MRSLRAHWTLRRWLSAYLDGELTGDLLQRVPEHVAHCQACQRDLENIHRGRDLLLHLEALPAGVPSGFQRIVPVMRWASIAALVLAIVGGSVWWRLPSVHAMSIDFYAEQFRMANRCPSPCTSISETTLGDLRRSSPFAVQYPSWLPEGMVLERVVRYRTALAEGIGLIFAGHEKKFCIFQQPRRLGVAAPGRHTSSTRICGQKCTRIESDRVQLFNWTNGRYCFVVATNISKDEVEAVVNSLGDLAE